MDYEQIIYETDDEIALITLNRPERLNAWTRQMSRELTDAVQTANADSSIGAMVFTGAGRGFCAGADIEAQFKAQLDKDPSSAGDGSQADRATAKSKPAAPADRATDWVQLVRDSKPMVAAINGASVGVGLTLVLPMDQILASDKAKLSCRFVKMGLTPELASSHWLVQRCGWGAASDLCLSGRMVEASEAASLGLIDRVVPHDSLLEAAIGKAREYASNPDPQLRMIKRLLTLNGTENSLEAVQAREMEALNTAYRTPEFKEAVDAFLEKRPAKFR